MKSGRRAGREDQRLEGKVKGRWTGWICRESKVKGGSKVGRQGEGKVNG
jgi:hypothetical protein